MTTFVQAVGGTNHLHQNRFVANARSGAAEEHRSCAFRKIIIKKNWIQKLAKNGRLGNKNVIKTSVTLKVYVMKSVHILKANEFALLWGETQLCLPYIC